MILRHARLSCGRLLWRPTSECQISIRFGGQGHSVDPKWGWHKWGAKMNDLLAQMGIYILVCRSHCSVYLT